MKNACFITFLNKIKPLNENLIENIYTGYSLLYETTQDKVNDIKNKLPSKNISIQPTNDIDVLQNENKTDINDKENTDINA